jgi:plasmid stabilization system protein ParE
MEVVWAETARKSLSTTLKFISANFGDAVARNIRHEIESRVELLAQHPMMGKKDVVHSTSDRVFRYIIVKRRSEIYYLLQNDMIYIVLVWDVRQDILALKQSLEKV